MKKTLKQQALSLRKQGYSYGYISEKLNLSKGTLSYWLRFIKFTPNLITKNRIKEGLRKSVKTRIKKRNIELNKIRRKGSKILGEVSDRDLFLTGIGLYWGEGRKFDETVGMTNSDPRVIKFFIKWLNVYCKVPIKDLKGEIHLYPDNNELKSRMYWKKVTGFNDGQFYKTQIDRRKGKKLNKSRLLPHGTIHIYMTASTISVRGLHRMIMGWVDEIAGVA